MSDILCLFSRSSVWDGQHMGFVLNPTVGRWEKWNHSLTNTNLITLLGLFLKITDTFTSSYSVNLIYHPHTSGDTETHQSKTWQFCWSHVFPVALCWCVYLLCWHHRPGGAVVAGGGSRLDSGEEWQRGGVCSPLRQGLVQVHQRPSGLDGQKNGHGWDTGTIDWAANRRILHRIIVSERKNCNFVV